MKEVEERLAMKSTEVRRPALGLMTSILLHYSTNQVSTKNLSKFDGLFYRNIQVNPQVHMESRGRAPMFENNFEKEES